MYSRIRSLLAGGTLLIEAHHSEEALMLGRTLFTESLWLMMLDAAGNERAAYALRWSLDSLQFEESLVHGGVKDGAYSDEESEQLLASIKDRRRRIQDYQHRHNIGRLRRLGDERSMAAKTDRSSEMVTFLLAHQMVHGSDVSHITRRDRVAATGHYRFAKESRNERLDAGVATFIGRSGLYGYRAVCHIVRWPEPALFDSLMAEADRLLAVEEAHPD
jgi:hypothetical protein